MRVIPHLLYFAVSLLPFSKCYKDWFHGFRKLFQLWTMGFAKAKVNG